jgi:REP element-mobilizing transposase RayT
MAFYRRRLPHWLPDNSALFVTWRLAGSPPPIQPVITFAERDAHFDRATGGPFWLRDPRIAEMIQEALRYGESPRKLYDLHAWCIMPNHIHVIWEPHVPLAKITQWLKGRTARKANAMLGRTGQPFWQDESYDHWIRTNKELDSTIAYVERNPLIAGLVASGEDWPWSSAWLRADDEKRSSAPRLLA